MNEQALRPHEASRSLFGELRVIGYFSRITGLCRTGVHCAKQRKRNPRLHLAYRALPQQIGQVAGLVDAKDEENLVSVGYPNVLAGSRCSR
jgi:hypothetical protein